MRAVVIEEYGGPEVVRVGERPAPQAGPGEVAIAVRFASMNYTDVRNRIGDGLGRVPFVPGVEAAGRILSIGDGVEGFSVGQPVCALTRGSAHAEVAVAPAALTIVLTEELASRPESGALLVTVPLALILLREAAHVSPDDAVLVHSAAGGVGTALAQVAAIDKMAPLWGTVGSPAKADYATAHGYGQLFSYDDFQAEVLARTEGRGVDVVLDPVGGAVRRASLEVLAPFGRLVTYSNVSREPEPLPDAEWLRARCLACAGISVGQLSGRRPELVRKWLEEAVRLVQQGALEVGVTDVLTLEEAAAAHRLYAERRVRGKLVLDVASSG
jgi:NADPH2:quinone reductase